MNFKVQLSIKNPICKEDFIVFNENKRPIFIPCE